PLVEGILGIRDDGLWDYCRVAAGVSACRGMGIPRRSRPAGRDACRYVRGPSGTRIRGLAVKSAGGSGDTTSWIPARSTAQPCPLRFILFGLFCGAVIAAFGCLHETFRDALQFFPAAPDRLGLVFRNDAVG